MLRAAMGHFLVHFLGYSLNGNGDSNNDGTYTGDPSVMPDFWN